MTQRAPKQDDLVAAGRQLALDGWHELWEPALRRRLIVGFVVGLAAFIGLGLALVAPLLGGAPEPFTPPWARAALTASVLLPPGLVLTWSALTGLWSGRGYQPRVLLAADGLLTPKAAPLRWSDVTRVRRLDRRTLEVTGRDGARLLLGGPLASAVEIEALAADLQERLRHAGETPGTGAFLVVAWPSAAAASVVAFVAGAATVSLELALSALGASDWSLTAWFGVLTALVLLALSCLVFVTVDANGVALHRPFARPRRWAASDLRARLEARRRGFRLVLQGTQGPRVTVRGLVLRPDPAERLANLLTARGARVETVGGEAPTAARSS